MQLFVWSPLSAAVDRRRRRVVAAAHAAARAGAAGRMSFHPNDVSARGTRRERHVLAWRFVFLLRGVLPRAGARARRVQRCSPRRTGCARCRCPRRAASSTTGTAQVIAENLSGLLGLDARAERTDSLRAALQRLSATISLTPDADRGGGPALPAARRRGPRSICADATFDVGLGARGAPHRVPGLIIQAAPKRYLPGQARPSRRSSATRARSTKPSSDQPAYADYKPGQQIGKAGSRSSTRRSCAARKARVRRGRRARSRRREAGGRATRPAAGGGADPAHEHRPRPAALRRRRCSATRCRAARWRWTRRPVRCSRSTARRASTPTGSSAASRRRTTTRCSTRPAHAAVQQGAAGALPAGVDVQARDGDHGAGGRRRRLDDRMPKPCTGGYSSAIATSGAGRRRATATLTLRAGDREVVRRLLLPARPQARARPARSPAACQLGMSRARPASTCRRRSAPTLAGRAPRTSTSKYGTGDWSHVGDAEPVDRSG